MTFASRSFLRGDEHRTSYVGLNDDDAALIKTLGFAAKRYPADAVVFSQGDSNDRVYIVESGWGCISHELPGGQRQILDFALTGDVVLPQSYGSGAVETFVAQTELSLLVASTKTLTLAAMKSPHLFSFIVEALVRNGAVIAQHLANVVEKEAVEIYSSPWKDGACLTIDLCQHCIRLLGPHGEATAGFCGVRQDEVSHPHKLD
jgi:CRP-like cAMP-binding protein